MSLHRHNLIVAVLACGLLVVEEGWVQACDRDDPEVFDLALRCAGQFDWNICVCRAGAPSTPDPCASPKSDDAHWTCLQSQLTALTKRCAEQQQGVRNTDISDSWHEIWRYANNHNRASQITLPRDCLH
jgi:hypothetical protein